MLNADKSVVSKSLVPNCRCWQRHWSRVLLVLAALACAAPWVHAEQVLFSEDFEGSDLETRWALTGDWRFRTNSPCLGNDVGFASPFNALVFDYGSSCAYANDRFGYATLKQDITLPLSNPNVSLRWNDFVGAETGADFYFVQVSTDGGLTWPYEILRNSVDEKFWDGESADLSPFVGKTIRVRFGFTSDATITGLGWYVDDLAVVAEDLPAGVSAVAITGNSVTETNSGEVDLNFTIQISPANANPITLEHSTVNGTALAGLDFVGSSGPLTIPAGATSYILAIRVRGDAFTEGDETFDVTLSNASPNAVIAAATATGTIIDDEALTCSYEEDFEPKVGTFRWSTGYPSVSPPSDPASLGLWHIQDDSACIVGDSGFTSANHALVFNDETTCSYDNVAGWNALTPSNPVTFVRMTNSEPIPGRDALTAQLSFRHYLEISYSAIQSGVTTAAVQISTGGVAGPWETLREFKPEAPSTENFVIPWREEIISLNAYVGKAVMVRYVFFQPEEINRNDANGWYIDDFKICYGERPAGVSKVSIGDKTEIEGDSATKVLRFPVTIDPINTTPITLSYETVALDTANAATPEVDYISTINQVTIPANAAPGTATLDVLIIGEDEPNEGDEIFQIKATPVSANVFLVKQSATGTIQDNDVPSQFTVTVNGAAGSPPQISEGIGTAEVVVTIDTPRTVPITLNYSTIDDTAVSGPGLDFDEAIGSITLPANTTSQSFPITIFNDSIYEDPDTGTLAQENELFFVKLATDSPYADPGAPRPMEIVDNDPDDPSISKLVIDSAAVAEGSCPTTSSEERCGTLTQAKFRVTLNQPNTSEITLAYTTVDGTALANSDYVAKSGIVKFVPGDTSEDIFIDIWADRQIEAPETFRLVLSAPSGPVNVVRNANTCTISDDDFAANTFGANGDRVITRPLNTLDSTPYVDAPISGGPLDLNAAEFKGYDFSTLYGVEQSNIVAIDLFSNAATTTATSGVAVPLGESLSSLAWDQTNGIAYTASTVGQLMTVDLDTGVLTLIGTAPGAAKIVALAVHPTTARLYAVTIEAGVPRLYQIIRGNPAFTLVGPLTGITPADPSKDALWSADFDDATGELYLNVYVATGWVTKVVDIATGETRSLVQDPPVSSLAIASAPTPQSTQWSRDLYYPDREPNGLNFDGGTTLAGTDTGRTVASIGDVNSDTFDDFLLAAPVAEVGPLVDAGKAFLLYGGADGTASQWITGFLNKDATFESLIDGARGVLITGDATGMQLGVSASGFGDINGDKIADFGVGVRRNNNAGGVYIIFGSLTLPATISVASIGASTPVKGVRVDAVDLEDYVGASLAGAGDMNADGLMDVIIGAPRAGAGASVGFGAAYVIFGSASGIGNNGVVSLQSLATLRGLTVTGELPGDLFGSSVSGAGDVNGDGLDDIAITAPNRGAGAGAAYVLYGHIDYGSDEPRVQNIQLARLNLPPPVGSTDPYNLAFTATIPGSKNLGEFVTPSVPNAGRPGLLPGVRITGQGGGFGAVVKGVGDFNGDAVGDLLLTAPTFDGSAVSPPHWGRAYLLYGQAANTPEISAANIGGSLPGLLLTGVDNGDNVGSAAAGVGDVNGDGLTDVLLGAKDGESTGYDGEAYLIYGRSAFSGILSLRDLAGSSAQAQKGIYLFNTHGGAGYDFGRAVSGGGDFDDDGISDVIIGRDNGAFVFLGKSTAVEATYRNRMRSGAGDLSGLPGSGSVDLGEYVDGRVGVVGDGSISQPMARVGLQFKGGGTGSDLGTASTQAVTIYRTASPDLDVGENSAEDDARWTPGGVYWKVETDRREFTESTMTFYYRPEEIAGFDLQKVRVYYAKPEVAPNANTTWTLLPISYDPDRGALIVRRTHAKASAQTDFNGYYAIVQADFVVELGGVIPAVGLTNDQAYSQGPIVTPSGYTYWHSSTKRLYAVKDGNINVTWRDNSGNQVSSVNVLTVWPTLASGKFQNYVANTTPVSLESAGDIALQSFQIVNSDSTLAQSSRAGSATPTNEVQLNKRFNAGLNSTNNTTAARVLLLLADKTDPAQGNLYFQFLRVLNWDSPELLVPTRDFPIGTFIGRSTDSAYQTYHDELTGSPFVYSVNGPHAVASARYPGFYDPATRTGSIVWVNQVQSSANPAVLVFYQRGTKLIEARTGAPVREGTGNTPLKTFAWPYYSSRYNPVWPAVTAANTITISRQNGSQEIAPATFGESIDVYVQNDNTLPGFNPNEEHALVAAYGSGKAVFALRNDLNSSTTSSPYVLMTYNDPNDLDFGGAPRAKMRAFFVQEQTTQYPFAPWPGISAPQDPYEGVAGQLVLPPYPLSILRLSPLNIVDSGAYRDRNNSIWAISAGQITLKLFYPVQPDFYFPQAYKNRYPNKNFTNTAAALDDVPWLDGGIVNPGAASPGTVTYATTWPSDVPVMKLGEVLIEARQGLPQINGQCSVNVVYQQNAAQNGPGGNIVSLIDPVVERSVTLDSVPLDVEQALAGSDITFPGLPPALSYRIKYNQSDKKLAVYGRLVDPVAGFDYPLLNVLTTKDRDLLKGLSSDNAWDTACDALYNAAKNVVNITEANQGNAIVLALTSGNAANTGYVSLIFQNAASCSPLPVSVEIIKVDSDINPGSIAVVKPACVFEEKLTLLHTNDFAGAPGNFTFEWKTLPDEDGTIPNLPDGSPTDHWVTPDLGVNNPNGGPGVNEITISGPGLLTLTDNWFTVRYKRTDGSGVFGNRLSDWAPAQLAPGWIKRVVGQINPFNQRAGGGGIAGAEAQFAAFADDAPNVIGNMLSLAGPRYTGSVPLNCENLDGFGLIPIYSTVLDRGATLSIDALSPINNPNVNNALILAASRINDLYMLLGNEAYADAADPTIAFGTDDGEYGAEATSIHAFMNQTSSLLEEELALLRGRDNAYAPGTQVYPFYNRLVWNFTKDFTGGEVAYALNYNLADAVVGGDGVISEADARDAFPQGHGDAWGHYLTAEMTYYRLLRHPYFSWVTRSEGYLVGGQPVTVDYLDERKFARTAAAKARTGAEIVNLAYRQGYVEDPNGQWQNLVDDDKSRAWGFSEWSQRAGQAAFIDWAVGNAILPAVDPNPDHAGVTKIDRTTVPDLTDVAVAYAKVQSQSDAADQNLNPLGLGVNVIPFDINPSEIDDGLTHFEQIYTRATTALNNAVVAFDNANNSTQLLRRQADTQLSFERDVQDQELDFKARLIEIFGTPYGDDIGPGGSYPRDYDGPDLFHYMYTEESPLLRDAGIRDVYFKPTAGAGNQSDVAAYANNALATFDTSKIGNGGLTIPVTLKNYGLLNYSGTAGNVDSFLTVPTSTNNTINVKFNLDLSSNGRLGLRKPSTWTGTRRATGSLQSSQAEVVQNLSDLVGALKEYENFVADINTDMTVLQEQFRVNTAKLKLVNDRFDNKKDLKNAVFGITTAQIAIRTATNLAEKLIEAAKESVPTVTGIIIGFSNGIIIDGLSAVRGGLKFGGVATIEVLRAIADLGDIANMRLELEDEFADVQLEIDTSELDLGFEAFQAVKELEKSLRGELQLRLALYNQYENLVQSIANYSTIQVNAEQSLEQLDIFRKRVSADIQAKRYKDMAFRIFRNEQLQKYRAQYDLAARYTYLAAKAYDYETTMLSSDQRAGERFLTDIIQTRQLGTILDGEPQPGQGLANSLAIMSRNFGVLSGQLGFNNPQVETNRFSLRYELFRQLVGPDGDESWRTLLNQDYFSAGVGKVENLWDVPEFVQNCVAPANFGEVEPGLVIPFNSTITEGQNFFGHDAGGFDNSYDSTQFATKIRSVGIWFSNYDFFNLSNTPRVWLVPAGTDVLRSPTGAAGKPRYFNVLDQVLPVPYPIGFSDLNSPDWIPSVDGLDGQLTAVRRFGRLRAYHDSGEFSADEVNADSRLIGRSVWNTRWMLIIPGSTFSSDSTEGLETFINGRNVGGVRDGNGVKDIKIFFQTYAYPRMKNVGGAKSVDTGVADPAVSAAVVAPGTAQ